MAHPTTQDDRRPTTFFTADHRRCDALWSAVERLADGEHDSAAVQAAWEKFNASMLRHLAMEEEVLFPAVEDATGMHGGGPTAVMRAEHAQMRQTLQQMQGCVESGDLQALLDHGDMLMMLMQQHNVKEEGILYPMCDRALAGEWAALLARLARDYPAAP